MSAVENDALLKNEYISMNELCDELSISQATAKNWIRLKKITPIYKAKSQVYFTKEYMNLLVKNIKKETSAVLKSRRNKKFVSGSLFYKDYISYNSKNIDGINSLLSLVKEKELTLSEIEIKYILADCAIKLLAQNNKFNMNIKNNFVEDYVNKKISFNNYNKLIDFFIDDKNCVLEFVKKNPDLFGIDYLYEKNEDILGLLYISLSNLQTRKKMGAYYTPTDVVKKITNKICKQDIAGKDIIDPCCGTGNFLLKLSDKVSVENIYGNDIDETAIYITRLNIVLNFKIDNLDILYNNFKIKDFLNDEENKKYDYILGNPPWGAEFSKKYAEELRKKYISAKTKNIESYDVFTEKALSCLKKSGFLFFVLPEAILSVKAHYEIRKFIIENACIKGIEFLGDIFNKVQCPSIILNLKKDNAEYQSYGIEIINKNNQFLINAKRELTPETFNLDMRDEEYLIYKKILSGKDKVYLKDNAIFALGIVTGDNKKFLSNLKSDSNEIILKGSDIEKFKINKPNNYIKYEPEKFQQVAPTKYYRVQEKLLYKFISKKLVFAYDNKKTLSLNSCNLLIPQISGMDIKYILAILNSRIAQFVFEKKYNSIKVLRSHIESIPIPKCSDIQQFKIIKLVNNILYDKKANVFEEYESLEREICKLYCLNDYEYNLLKNSLNS